MPDEQPRTPQQAEQRVLVADLVRTQAILQARSEQLQRIFASRWYRLARFSWRLRRGSVLRKAGPPKLAGEQSFAQSLNGEAIAAEEFGSVSLGEPGGVLESDPQRQRQGGGQMPSLERPREAVAARKATRLLIAGHSLSFCGPLARRARQGGAAVREDRWQTHGAHDEGASAAALAWADVVHCEWCLGNAVWYSRNKRPGQRLIVRFHRMELDTPYPGEVDLERVDAMAFVAQHVLEKACERFGWSAEDPRFQVIPNGIEAAALDQAKLPGAEFTLGAIGYVPRLKRIDRAIDVLELLRRRDERYRLIVKGREPWEYAWMSARDEERDYFEGLFGRLEREPDLRRAIDFEPFDDDVPAYLRQIGWILSTSEVEGHSVALAEGMASGAVPAIVERPGAREQYETRWVHPDADAAAQAILDTQARGGAATEGESASRFAERWSWERLGPIWDRLLPGDSSASRESQYHGGPR